MGIVLNEREAAITSLQEHNLGDDPLETLGRIARYYRAEGYKKPEILNLMEIFLVRCNEDVVLPNWKNTLNAKIKETDWRKLVEIDSIHITQNEIEMCDAMSTIQKQRLLFTLICLAKYRNAVRGRETNWINYPNTEIFKLANIVTNSNRRDLMLNDLYNAGLIHFNSKVDDISINVSCVDSDGESAIEISDFRNLGNQYMRFVSDGYMECQSCGAVIKKMSNVHRFCKLCAAEEHRRQNRKDYSDAAMH